MLINLNGKPEEVGISLSLVELIASKGLCAEKIVVEYNLRILPKEEWINTHLQENDKIEIVSFVGGG